ncbi:GNAT family N-acetyltransferase [Paenibacillus sp. OK076]|uniref:GNAT family N-acetyltransferase n=1 Tax=Paenibacillus sp. OK076 TaxID=1884379 RepID=UPI0008CA7927|nr:GNAT family protein [Paenibacillus sp. OK076]SEM99799.1 Protein N-acetyltransferase, RimJ/RimL family [Paenibacillus sp. OK076]
MEFAGQKIRITPVTEQDLDFICTLECDASIWSFEEDVETDTEKVRDKYRSHFSTTDEEPYAYDFIIRRLEDPEGEPIGLIQMWSYVGHRKSWELGFALLPNYVGNGYGSEATKLLLEFAFNGLHAHKVIGMCNAQNVRSAALMQHVGMTREAVFKEELWWNNQWTDQYFFSILEKEFIERRGRNSDDQVGLVKWKVGLQ